MTGAGMAAARHSAGNVFLLLLPAECAAYGGVVAVQNGKSSGSVNTITMPMMICSGRPTFT